MGDPNAFQGLAERPRDETAPATPDPGAARQVPGGACAFGAAAFDLELAAWLFWLDAARISRADRHSMRRLELICATSWVAMIVTCLAIPLVGFAALVLSLVVLAAMLLSVYLVTAAGLDQRDKGAPTGCGWPILGPEERPRLVRIINLSRVVKRRVALQMLFREVDEALAVEPLASWPPLRDLRDLLCDNDDELTPFGAVPPSGVQGRAS